MTDLSDCPACGSVRLAVAYEGRTTRDDSDGRVWSLSRCQNCSHEFVNPQPDWEELAPYYSASYPAYDPNHGTSGRQDDQLVAEAQRKGGEFRHVMIRPGLRLLDVGCGGGMFLRIARRLGAVVEGSEPSADGVAAARAADLSVFQGTAEEFAAAHPERRFDLITASHVLEHVPQPVATLSAMSRLLDGTGRIWISVPNAACRFCRDLKHRWHSTDLPIHLMQFSPASLRTAAERAGLQVHSLGTYSLNEAVEFSLQQWFRHRYHVPMRVWKFGGPLQRIAAAKLARRMDARGAGEAILAEFTQGAAPVKP